MNTLSTIAEVITAASGRLARLTSSDYTVDIRAGYRTPSPHINVQVGHWLPSDDERLRVIHNAAQAISLYACWLIYVQVYEPGGGDSGTLHLAATIDGIRWDVWAALAEPGRAQVEYDLCHPDELRTLAADARTAGAA